MTALPARLPSAVNKSLTPNRPRRVVENDEYAAFLRRVIRAYSRRVAAGDIEAIAAMAAWPTKWTPRCTTPSTASAEHRLQLGRHRAPARRLPPGRPATLGR